NEKGDHIDVDIRKTDFTSVSKNTYWSTMETYMNLKPQLEAFFDMPLLGIEVPEFLYYSSGSFFTAHTDVLATHKNERKISTVLFLNQQTNDVQTGDYEGGELCLYGLNKLFPKKGFAMPSSQGLLVAFRSEVMHEVKPILSGTRCSLVVWYH
ncbi:MAG: 2OG-Fe(II) oxygenase, partial [Flammeovirgaceae bacterium]